MTELSAIQRQLIEALSHRASLCRLIFSVWSGFSPDVPLGAKELTVAAHLSHSDEVGTSEILRTLKELGLLEGVGPRWTPKAALARELKNLSMIFNAIDTYKSRVQKNDTEVKLVTTTPDRALALDRELTNAGWQMPRAEDTDESMVDLFAGAARRILVMTPFLDLRGGQILKALLERTRPEVEVWMILRNLDRPGRPDYPAGYTLLREFLWNRGARLFDYTLQHEAGAAVETFHAKLVLADDRKAYVGSANMTGASFEHSVELGVLLTGKAARQLSHIAEAIIRCAKPWNLAA
jgi:phosphatidylserine/phosphatidylglycerophosphate/cardiolipin synthase-like enzyme